MLRVALLSVHSAPEMVAAKREMATLKEISMRLRSVSSIQKITKSMKMVSAAKFARAEQSLRRGKALGPASIALSEKANIKTEPTDSTKHLLIGVSSDRGLCGSIHSGIGKAIKRALASQPAGVETKVVAYGDKLRGIVGRVAPEKLLLTVSDVGKRPPTFAESSFVAENLLKAGYDFTYGQIFFNQFKSAVEYKMLSRPVLSPKAIEGRDQLNAYDDVSPETLKDYLEFNLACSMFYASMEGAASEQSARMTAMDNASNNAGDMIDSLRLTFNRTRQSVITRELIEIISGASALE